MQDRGGCSVTPVYSAPRRDSVLQRDKISTVWISNTVLNSIRSTDVTVLKTSSSLSQDISPMKKKLPKPQMNNSRKLASTALANVMAQFYLFFNIKVAQLYFSYITNLF